MKSDDSQVNLRTVRRWWSGKMPVSFSMAELLEAEKERRVLSRIVASYFSRRAISLSSQANASASW